MATRGTAFLVTDKYILETVEFNGDMYRDGLGQEMVNILNEVKNVNDFKEGVDNFNKENHDYEGFDLSTLRVRVNYIEENTRGEDIIKFTDENYFKLYFSDWTFWKNLSSKDITFQTREYGKVRLNKGEVVAICFGKNVGHYFGTKKSLEKDLESIMPS
jgi:hypothetical protein